MMALLCDFRLITDGKAWCCMNEVSLILPLKQSTSPDHPFVPTSYRSTLAHPCHPSSPVCSTFDYQTPGPPTPSARHCLAIDSSQRNCSKKESSMRSFPLPNCRNVRFSSGMRLGSRAKVEVGAR